MRNLQENIVPSKNQNPESFYPEYNTGIRIMFVGNSITKHAPKESIGWFNDCGMAASSLEKDYVHILESRIKETHPNASFAILQVADFERNFSDMNIKEFYGSAFDYNPDIVVMFFGANVDKKYDDLQNPDITFGSKYEELRNLIDKNNQAKVIHLQGFYIREKLDNEKKAVSDKYNDIFINIEEIRNDENMHGEFNHPSDDGMLAIADKIWDVMKDMI